MVGWTRQKYVKLAKGFYGRMKNCARVMIPKVEKSLQYAYRDRRVRPRRFRTENILSINAAVREHHINYSRFIFGLNQSNVYLDRKILANIALNEPYSFKAIVDEIKIQGKLVQKNPQQVSYLDALAQGYLIQGPLKEGQQKIIKDVDIIGVIGEEKLSPEQKAEILRK